MSSVQFSSISSHSLQLVHIQLKAVNTQWVNRGGISSAWVKILRWKLGTKSRKAQKVNVCMMPTMQTLLTMFLETKGMQPFTTSHLYDWIRMFLKCYALGKDETIFLVISSLFISLIMKSTHVLEIILCNYLSYSKDCWFFHPLYLECFLRVLLVSYVIELFMRLTYVVIDY